MTRFFGGLLWELRLPGLRSCPSTMFIALKNPWHIHDSVQQSSPNLRRYETGSRDSSFLGLRLLFLLTVTVRSGHRNSSRGCSTTKSIQPRKFPASNTPIPILTLACVYLPSPSPSPSCSTVRVHEAIARNAVLGILVRGTRYWGHDPGRVMRVGRRLGRGRKMGDNPLNN